MTCFSLSVAKFCDLRTSQSHRPDPLPLWNKSLLTVYHESYIYCIKDQIGLYIFTLLLDKGNGSLVIYISVCSYVSSHSGLHYLLLFLGLEANFIYLILKIKAKNLKGSKAFFQI